MRIYTIVYYVSLKKSVFFLTFYFLFAPQYAPLHAEERQWEEPLEQADLLLFSAHADDEHLFFAGILPFCAANGIKAQVVYVTNHDDFPARNVELRNGLWAVGIRNSPVIAHFPDLFSETLNEALRVYGRRGFSMEDFIMFHVENIRRFKPLVVVGHDIDGEYGHGTHILSAAAIMRAVELAGGNEYHAESLAQYGSWDVPKTYLNQWKERNIKLSIDEPLLYFEGKTAFQVSQYGFSYHKSQHWTMFNRWLNGTAQAPITSSAQIRNHPPGRFGLFRTLVGDDSENADNFFENIVLIKDIPEDIPQEPPEPEITENFGNETYRPLIPVLAAGASIVLLLFFIIKNKRKNK